MSKLIAKIISTILNPLVILTVTPYILIVKETGDASKAYFWTLFSLIFTLIFSVIILIGIEKGYFSDLDISKRSQRPVLYTAAVIMSLIYIVFLFFLKAPVVLFIALFGLILGLIFMEMINRVTKASVHVAAIAAFATALTVGINYIYVWTFVFVPLVAWARIKTHNHTKRQTLIGATMGILITLTVYVIFKYIV